ncbi:MAG: flagellar hook-length control protein FliK [Hyphomicrobiales bacterium]|nr:MAG: flagellar hook-length control protein FliK [Hyphomicrobiales bacterium]
MTPMDLNIARAPVAADPGAVQAASSKAGGGEDAEAGSGFGDALKTVAKDQHEKSPAQPKTAGSKSKDTSLDRWRKLDADKAALNGRDVANAQDKADRADALEEAAAALLGENKDTQAGDDTGNAGATTSAMVPGSAEQALALILAHTPRPAGANKGEAALGDSKDGTTASLTAADADVSAAKPLRDVKITAVKVETHFAPIANPAIAASLAQKIANAGGTGKSADASAAAQTAGAGKPGDDKLVSLKDLDIAQPSAVSRGKAVAGAGVDKRGADGFGNGGGSGADAKAAAASIERKPVAAPADTTQPGTAASPVQQLGQRLLSAASELKSDASAPMTSTGADQPQAAAPVRVLSINLHPEELGSVTVRMTLVRDALEVQIEAEHHSTARMLQTDSDALSDMLRSAGIQVDGVTVRAAAPDTVSAGTGAGQSTLDGQGQGTPGGDARGTGGGGGRQDRPQGYEERSTGRGGYENDTSQRAAAGGLYV